MDRSLELGIHFWDTAESYGPYLNEELLAKSLKGRREKVILATKFGWKNGVVSPENLDGSAENVRSAVEGSLKRFATGYIDLLYLHRLDPKTPIEETVTAMSQLVKEGKVQYIGLSEVGPQTIRRAHRIHPLTALQSEYSLWETGVEGENSSRLKGVGYWFCPLQSRGPGLLNRGNQKIR